ncbi:SurA N-terminal domain-containing protein [Bacillus marinisedimentorum]|uniref:SurA N-terminal domain-containing protein n=1 Tax=Bacillus marinisedimentorum TaxID=1821260 RepID=UPI0008731066|nr:SurA N-terminal domain-containing protein [Bacillus marinisedimentorum]
MKLRKISILLLSVLTAFVFTACSGDEEAKKKENETAEEQSGEKGETAKRDKDATVAVVNGEKIKQEELDGRVEQVALAYEQQGIELDKKENSDMFKQVEKQALNQLVDSTLLIQAANEAGIEADEKKVNQSMEDIKANLGDNYEKTLEKYDMTEKELKKQVADEMKIQKYISENTEEVTVTDEEAKKVYDEQASQQEDLPPFEEVKDSLKTQLVQQKQDEQTTKLVDKLRKKGEVDIKI